MRKTLAGVLFLLLFVACTPFVYSAPAGKLAEKPLVPTGPLRELAQQRGLLIGTSVVINALETDPTYAKMLAHEFDVVTPENVMKFDATEPLPGTFTFQAGDELVKFAQAHQMQVHGHNLVWHQALPAWVSDGTFTREQLMVILKQHIQTVVGHYKGQVNIWDVVNEGIDSDGTLRKNLWERIIGPDYLDLAFQWAHEANPAAHLFYNDYNAEDMGIKSNGVYTLVKSMVQRGVPIYGVGLQMHITIDSMLEPAEVIANMQRLVALGLHVQITEMDVQVQIQHDTRSLSERLRFQGQVYGAMLSACLAVRGCESFTMWGFTDRYTWIPEAVGHADIPLIFDAFYHPKPAYTALLRALST